MIENIEFVSAGAGSGKTYKLTQTLAEALESGTARPQAIVATTFTVKAATELRERVRSSLLERRRIDLATAIGQAHIGTVNGVCGQLLQRFCFELGLSPDQTVLGEGQAERLLEMSIAETLDVEGQLELVRLTTRFGIEQDDWSATIRQVVKAALQNNIEPAALRRMGPRNADRMLANWPKPTEDSNPTSDLTAALVQGRLDLAALIDQVDASGKKVTKTLSDGLKETERLARVFENDVWSWLDWLAACSLNAGASARDTIAPIHAAAQTHASHPDFHAEVHRYLARVFELAAEALDAYALTKQKLGAVDFSDQEVLLLRAVRENPSVRDALAADLDLVMVDEFQDTSPLQLALFVEFAKLARRSIWVGDPKQAIYGFRGTDASLIDGVISAIPGWGGTIGQALTTSRRSTPSLVSLSNAVFSSAFEPQLSPRDVHLQPHRSDVDGQPALLNWTFESNKNSKDFEGLGPAVRDLLASGMQVADKATGTLRPVRAGDIGVLCRKNDQVDLAVTSLTGAGIPSASPRSGLLATAEAILVLACLRRLHDAADTVATALILTLADGQPVQDWLPDRLAYLAQEGVRRNDWKTQGDDAHPLLAHLAALSPMLATLTPREALQLAATESQVARTSAGWADSPHEARHRRANVEALLDLGSTYEDECTAAKRPATVSGLLRWLDALAEASLDERAAVADDSVSVLTYHRAKGLEWPVVILTSLGDEARTALWSVRARTDGVFDPNQPLANRFVHCWIRTWGRRSVPPPAVQAQASDLGLAMQAAALAESKRLLYVGLTRARDVNVLVSCARKSSITRQWVEEIPGASELLFGDGSLLLPDGRQVLRSAKVWSQAECELRAAPAASQTCHWFTPQPRVDALPLWHRPSAAVGTEQAIVTTEPVGSRIALASAPDMADLGTALHLCIARAVVLGRVDPAEVRRILNNWAVQHAIDPMAVVDQITAFFAWKDQRWPGCTVLVEVPIESPGPDGTRIRGRIDLLIDTPAGWILVDHKSNPGGISRDEELVRAHGPQLASYEQALREATGRRVIEKWLYLPVAGRRVRVG